MINANICPENRVKKENLMITSIIPGPKEPKHFNSFMYSIVNELKDLECKLVVILAFFKLLNYNILLIYLICSWDKLL
jgi:hypothetical protein